MCQRPLLRTALAAIGLFAATATASQTAAAMSAESDDGGWRSRSIHERVAARRALLSSTVGIRDAAGPAAPAPAAPAPSITVEKDLDLGSASNIFKNSSLFLWDDGLAGNNLGLGRYALSNNTSGSDNTALGYDALYYNDTGIRNTAVGRRALYNTRAGNENTAVGRNAVYRGDTSFNTAVGHFALGGYYGAPGSDNTALGWQAGYYVYGGAYNIHIGSGVVGASGDTYTTRIGNLQTQVYVAGIFGSSVGGTNQPVYVDSSGKLGMGPSSRRLKTEVRDLGALSEAALELRPVSFRMASTGSGSEGPLQWGLIAEEVAAVLPGMVIFDAAGQPLSVRYNLLSTLLLNELQKQDVRMRRQALQLEELRRRLGLLEAAESTAPP